MHKNQKSIVGPLAICALIGVFFVGAISSTTAQPIHGVKDPNDLRDGPPFLDLSKPPTTMPDKVDTSGATAITSALLAVEQLRTKDRVKFGRSRIENGTLVTFFSENTTPSEREEHSRASEGLRIRFVYTGFDVDQAKEAAEKLLQATEINGDLPWAYDLADDTFRFVDKSTHEQRLLTSRSLFLQAKKFDIQSRSEVIAPNPATPLYGGSRVSGRLQNGQTSSPFCTTTFGVVGPTVWGSMTAGHCTAIGQQFETNPSPLSSYTVTAPGTPGGSLLTQTGGRRTDSYWDSVVIRGYGNWLTYTGPSSFPTFSQISGLVDMPSQTIHMTTNLNICWYGQATAQQQCSFATQFNYPVVFTSGNLGVPGQGYSAFVWKLNFTACGPGDSGAPVWLGSNPAASSIPMGILIGRDLTDGTCLVLSLDDQLSNANVSLL